MPGILMLIVFMFNQHPSHNDGIIIAVILLFIRERNICKTYLNVCQSIKNMNTTISQAYDLDHNLCFTHGFDVDELWRRGARPNIMYTNPPLQPLSPIHKG